MNIKMIGHSTVLIEIGGHSIITDPYFGKIGNVAFKRPVAPFVERSDYAALDLVLVSHIHFDHMDGKFFRMLSKESKVVLPRAMGFVKGLLGIKNAIGLRNYEKTTIKGINITSVPAIHSTVTCGYIIEAEGKCIYFSGDTYHGGFMKELSKKYNIDIALMPVATFQFP
jgi:L-ascorbate metabolism protein UlaG (beta-lactamase superfamily)